MPTTRAEIAESRAASTDAAPGLPRQMKALVQEGYGSPEEVLRLREVPLPRIGDRDVLVRIHAGAVNALDWHVTRGRPWVIRLAVGWPRPRLKVRGVDMAGRVEAVGKSVTGFARGDEVFGGASGSFAEYARSRPAWLAHRPATLAPHLAASLYVGALTALQGLRDKVRLSAGQRILIHGAGGGVGTFAVQLAKWMGAHVTAVTRTEHVEMLRALGADVVLDYRREDFTRRPERYDALFDLGGTHSLADCRRVLTRRGTLLAVGAPADRLPAALGRFGRATLLRPFVAQRFPAFISHHDPAGLALLKALVERGVVRPVIGREFPLGDAAAAIRGVGEGHAAGKIIVRVA